MSSGVRGGRLADQVGMVTGAASGIGRAVAERLGAEGATVVCLDVNNAGQVAEGITKAGGTAEALVLDVSSARGWSEVVGDVISRLGAINFLVNVAGIGVTAPDVADTVTTLSEEWWDRLIAINLKGSWLGMRAVIPQMQTAGGGRIVNTSSVAGSRGIPGLAVYSTTKGGVDALTRQAASEYGADGILINAICPGTILKPLSAIRTEEFENANVARHILKRLGEPSEVASMIVYLLSEGTFITGAVIPIDGGWGARA
jgi:NAD(P)-dependent dehydrogenase (short-subunit alcohol dehydrogenase family)